MKKILTITLSGLCALLVACNMVSYEGPYNQNGYFDGNKSAYFLIEKETDTLQAYTFSIRPADVVEHTFKVPVRILGTPSKNATKVGVTIVSAKSNAVEGTHYKPFTSEIVIPADSLRGYLEVTMLRKALLKDNSPKMRLTLALTPTDDYQIVGGARNEVVLSVDDFFDDRQLSERWNLYYAGTLGKYNRTVYLKLLELYGWDEKLLWTEFFQKTRFWVNWNKTISYFNEHPESGIKVELPKWMEGYLPYRD